MLEDRTRKRILRSGLQELFWNNDTEAFPKSFAGILQISSDETSLLLKVAALVAYMVYAVSLKFNVAYERWQILSGHRLIAFLPVE